LNHSFNLTKYKYLVLAGNTFVAFFGGGKPDTTTLRQRDETLGALADHEHVAQSGGEGVSLRIAHMDNIEATRVSLARCDDTDSTQIVSARDHAQVASFELDEVQNLALLNVVSDGVVHLNERIRIADGAAIMGDQEWNALRAGLDSSNSAQLVRALFGRDLVQDESTLHVIEQSEEIAGLFNGDNIHESSRESVVGANTIINLNGLLHDNLSHFGAGQGVLESVAKDYGQRKRLTQLVRAGGRSRGKYTAEFVQHP